VRKRLTPIARTLTFLGACLGAVVVGAVDVATGAEVLVVSLYFAPLVFAGWQLGRAGAATVALFSTVVWIGALVENGVRYAPAMSGSSTSSRRAAHF
jgi:hypothetical protein